MHMTRRQHVRIGVRGKIDMRAVGKRRQMGALEGDLPTNDLLFERVLPREPGRVARGVRRKNMVNHRLDRP